MNTDITDLGLTPTPINRGFWSREAIDMDLENPSLSLRREILSRSLPVVNSAGNAVDYYLGLASIDGGYVEIGGIRSVCYFEPEVRSFSKKNSKSFNVPSDRILINSKNAGDFFIRTSMDVWERQGKAS